MRQKLATLIPELNKDERRKLRVSAAAGTYYGLFALAPLMVALLLIGGFFIGPETLREGVLSYTTDRFGSESLPFFSRLADGMSAKKSAVTLVVTTAIFLYAITRYMTFIRNTLRLIISFSKHDVFQKSPLLSSVVSVSSFFFIIALGALLIVFQIMFSVLATVALELQIFAYFSAELLYISNAFLNIFSLGTLIAFLYLIAESSLSWRNAFIGGMVASVLITLINTAVSLYVSVGLSHQLYGAYGFILLLFIWLYYTMHGIFYGAYVARGRK